MNVPSHTVKKPGVSRRVRREHVAAGLVVPAIVASLAWLVLRKKGPYGSAKSLSECWMDARNDWFV